MYYVLQVLDLVFWTVVSVLILIGAIGGWAAILAGDDLEQRITVLEAKSKRGKK